MPAHSTFFTITFGSQFWVYAFGVLAAALLAAACGRSASPMNAAHAACLVVFYVFGIGNVIGNLQLHASWLVGGLALVYASGEVLVIRLLTDNQQLREALDVARRAA